MSMYLYGIRKSRFTMTIMSMRFVLFYIIIMIALICTNIINTNTNFIPCLPYLLAMVPSQRQYLEHRIHFHKQQSLSLRKMNHNPFVSNDNSCRDHQRIVQQQHQQILLRRTLLYNTMTTTTDDTGNTINDNTMNNNYSDQYSYLEKVHTCLQELSATENYDYVKEWNDTIQVIQSLQSMQSTTTTSTTSNSYSLSKEEIESSLAIAWNWKRYVIITSPIARKFIKTIVPNSTMIGSSIQWLQNIPLQLSNTSIIQGIQQCPETFLVQPNINYQKVLQIVPQPYRSNLTLLHEFIQQYPCTLQYTYNCIDTGCKSECGNCWVSYQYQLSEIKKI